MRLDVQTSGPSLASMTTMTTRPPAPLLGEARETIPEVGTARRQASRPGPQELSPPPTGLAVWTPALRRSRPPQAKATPAKPATSPR